MTAQMFEYEELKNLFKINYFAPIMLTKGLADKRNNVGKQTSLVYISSADAIISSKGLFGYSGSKAALAASVKAISKEVSRFGIRANCVLPSAVKTPMTIYDDAVSYKITEENQQDNYPFGWAEPEDVANMIVYLLSDKAKFISGQNYVIDSGGMV